MNQILANSATLPLSVTTSLLIVLAFFLVAIVYSAAGLGGGSSYLALLTLVIDQHDMIRSLALICNLAVVTGSVLVFGRAGLLSAKTALPLVMASIPMAFLGATVDLPPTYFYRLLAITLILAAIVMLLRKRDGGGAAKPLRPTGERSSGWFSFMGPSVGGSVGLLSGLAGVGGGIFLSPILNLLQYDTPKRVAAIAAFFILVNSVSGLIGLQVAGNFDSGSPFLMAGLLVAVVGGGQIGVRTSVARLGLCQVRQVTALVVLIAGVRLLFV